MVCWSWEYIVGAFGAHALKAHVKDEKMLKNWETAAHYHVRSLPGILLRLYSGLVAVECVS